MSENKNPFKQINQDSWNNQKTSIIKDDFKKIKKSKKKKVSFLWFFIWLLILGLFASVLLIFILIVWWPWNPLLWLLWIQAAQIQTSLLNITQTVFSIFSLWIFWVWAVFLFLWVLAKNDKKKFFIISWIFWWLLFLTVIIWLWLYNFIYWFNFNLDIKAEIEIQNQTWTSDLSKIITPAILDFSIKNWVLNAKNWWKQIKSIYWDFNNDGDFDSKWIEENISHEFNTPWNKKILVVLNFIDWTTQNYEKIFKIADWSFLVDNKSWTVPLKVTFDTQWIVDNSKNWISEFRWYFDWWENPDLITSKTIIEHIFKKIWKYNVVLITVDTKNNIKKYSKKIEVISQDWSSNLISNIKIFPSNKWVAPFKVRLTWENSVSKKWEIIWYIWNFWDFDKWVSWKELVKTFNKPWTFQVKLTIENEYWEKKSSEKTILVTWEDKAPVAKISSNLDTKLEKEHNLNKNNKIKNNIKKVYLPFNLVLNWSNSIDINNDIIKYSWDFNWDWVYDAFWEKVEKKFREAWDFKIKLVVEDSKWNKWESFLKFKAENSVKAIISTDKDSWVAPTVILFDASFSRVDIKDKIVNYSWDFWDWTKNNFSSAQKKHNFENQWVYDVVLNIFTEKWKTYKDSKKIFIREKSIQACFDTSKSISNKNSEIQFISKCSSWEIENWKWDFWDWKISYQRNPIHLFKKNWNYTVILQLTDYKNNVSEFRKLIKIK